jgi:hypothetical protein
MRARLHNAGVALVRLADVQRVVDEVVVDGDAPHALLVRLAAIDDRLSEERKPSQHLRGSEERVSNMHPVKKLCMPRLGA